MECSETARRGPLRALALAGLLLWQAGCTTALVRPPAPIPTGVAPSAAQVARLLEARDRELANFRAQARLDYRTDEQGFRSTQVVAVRAPASARIDVMHPFGVSYTVASDGRELSAFDRRENVYYQGEADAQSFERFIGIPMAAADFAAMLRGLPPGLGETRWSDVAAVEGGWLMRRRLGSGGVLELVVAADTFNPLRVKISGDRDRHEVEARYSDYRDVDGTVVPHRIEATFKNVGRLELVYKSVQKGVALPDTAFHVERPEGARFVNIDAEADGAL